MSFNEWIVKLWYINNATRVNRNKLLIHKATWTDFKDIMPNEKSQPKRLHTV